MIREVQAYIGGDYSIDLSAKLLEIRHTIQHFWEATTVGNRMYCTVLLEHLWYEIKIKTSYNTEILDEGLQNSMTQTLGLMYEMLEEELLSEMSLCYQGARRIVCDGMLSNSEAMSEDITKHIELTIKE